MIVSTGKAIISTTWVLDGGCKLLGIHFLFPKKQKYSFLIAI